MKLLVLYLRNFKGVQNFSLDIQGRTASIYGNNATGKTSIFDALTWLLFEKDSQNRKDFNIKTLDQNGQSVHGLEHEVEGIFDVNGQKISLRKVYKEKYTRKRGTATSELTGHTTDYYIDGVPSKKSEYEDCIKSICDETIFRLLTSPGYFNERLHWQERRKILLEICGDITDAEVIASNEALAKLPVILQGRKLDDHRKVIMSRRAEINKELDKIPVRIDEIQQYLPDVFWNDISEITTKVKVLKNRIQEKGKELAIIQGGGEIAVKMKTLREIEGKLLDIKNKHRIESEGKVQEKRIQLYEIKNEISALQPEIRFKQLAIQANEKVIRELGEKSAILRNEWHRVKDQAFEFSQETVCPTCGQSIPGEKLAETREKALANFNVEKSEKLMEISGQGKQYKAEIDKLNSQNIALAQEVNAMQNQLEILLQTVSKLQAEIETVMQSATSITDNPAYVNAIREKEAIEEQIKNINSNNSGMVTSIQAEITSLEAEIRTLEKSLAQVNQYNRGQARIRELQQQQKELFAEFERLEKELYLADQFIRTKVKMLDEKINSHFKMARFKLFDIQINGGVAECCETTYKGVPYSDLNNAAKVNVGLDIINALSEHYGFSAPIFIDNAEAVTELIETKGQVIKLIVNKADKKLRVEIDDKDNALREAM